MLRQVGEIGEGREVEVALEATGGSLQAICVCVVCRKLKEKEKKEKINQEVKNKEEQGERKQEKGKNCFCLLLKVSFKSIVRRILVYHR